MDDHDNLSAVVVVNDEVHDISLNFTHHPMRGGGHRLQILKNEAESIKRKLVDNLSLKTSMTKTREAPLLNTHQPSTLTVRLTF